MAAVALVSFVAGLAFLLRGAWPVFGFFGLDVLLVYVAFRLNYRAGRLVETVRLADDVLTVRRVAPGGRAASWTFQPYWLRVRLGAEGEGSPLTLTSHGRSLVIGSFLSPGERRDFAAALEDALARWRAPGGA